MWADEQQSVSCREEVVRWTLTECRCCLPDVPRRERLTSGASIWGVTLTPAVTRLTLRTYMYARSYVQFKHIYIHKLMCNTCRRGLFDAWEFKGIELLAWKHLSTYATEMFLIIPNFFILMRIETTVQHLHGWHLWYVVLTVAVEICQISFLCSEKQKENLPSTVRSWRQKSHRRKTWPNETRTTCLDGKH